MPLETTITIILSVVTAATAIAAIILSVVQISKSNKQSLFDRRLAAFLKVKWMVALCDEEHSLYKTYLADAEKGPIYAMDMLFGWLTNNTFLESVQLAAQNPTEPELKRKLLFKLEELKNLCEEVRLIFPDNIGYPMADFVFSYEELLLAMYRYQVLFKSITDSCNQTKRPFPENNSSEINCRKRFVKFLKDTFGFSEKLGMEGVLEKAKSKIKF